MTEFQAQTIAKILRGKAYNSGGNIWLVEIPRKDGSLAVISENCVCDYPDRDAFLSGREIGNAIEFSDVDTTVEQLLESLGNSNLVDQAAMAAAKVLAENWAAIRSRKNIFNLLENVNEVICVLKMWKKALNHNFG